MFSDIEQSVTAELQNLASKVGPAYGLQQYVNEGGQETLRPWRTSGFYVSESRNGRLVLEVLHMEADDTCVVRVFRERRLKVFYARKIVGKVERLDDTLEEAARAFRANLPAKPIRREDDNVDISALPSEMSQLISRLLLPVPPPVHLAEIEEA